LIPSLLALLGLVLAHSIETRWRIEERVTSAREKEKKWCNVSKGKEDR